MHEMVNAQGVKFDSFMIPAPQGGGVLRWEADYSHYQYKFLNVRAGILCLVSWKGCLSWEYPRIVWDGPVLISLLWTALFTKGILTRIWNGEMHCTEGFSESWQQHPVYLAVFKHADRQKYSKMPWGFRFLSDSALIWTAKCKPY